jgi:hypothetical protein
MRMSDHRPPDDGPASPGDANDLHVCISAYACNPSTGSEPGIGWNLVREVARRHRVWAMTRRKNQPSIAAALARTPLPKLTMVYVDLPRAVLACKHGSVGTELYYRAWQRAARRIADRLHARVGFDVTQHVTFGRYWGATALPFLPVPFIWGPVGGGESAPPGFVGELDATARVYEWFRDRARTWGERSPSVRAAARRAALGLAVTRETRARLLTLGTRRVELFSAMGLDADSYAALAASPPPDAARLRFISMGRLLHWKGFHLGLRAFAAARLPRSEYWIVGDGPQRAPLAALARDLGIDARVRFLGALPRRAALECLAQSHVLVHPSLHDSGGWVCLEAMATGRPVICLDTGGPSELLGDTGYTIAPDTPGQAVSGIAAAMTAAADPEPRADMGRRARERVRANYLWERKGEQLDRLYALALGTPPRTASAAVSCSSPIAIPGDRA